MTDLQYYREQCVGDTIGDFVRAVFRITEDENAARFYRGCVADIQAQMDAGKWQGRGTAEAAAKSNIGWCYGEGMNSKRIDMWQRVTGAQHPMFGGMIPTAEGAIEAGKRHGRKTA